MTLRSPLVVLILASAIAQGSPALGQAAEAEQPFEEGPTSDAVLDADEEVTGEGSEFASPATRVVIALEGQAEATASALMLDAPGLDAVVGPAPVGASSLLRASAARDLARDHDAGYAVWVEDDDGVSVVRVVRVSGGVLETSLRDVPEATWARFVSLAAASLIDEFARTPERVAQTRLWRASEEDVALAGSARGANPEADPEAHAPMVERGGLSRPPMASESPPSPQVPSFAPTPTSHIGRRDGRIVRIAHAVHFEPRVDPFLWNEQVVGVGLAMELGVDRYLNPYLRAGLIAAGGAVFWTGPTFSAGAQLIATTRGARTRVGFGAVTRLIIATECTNTWDLAWFASFSAGGVGELAYEFFGGALVARIEAFFTMHPQSGPAPGGTASLGWEWH